MIVLFVCSFFFFFKLKTAYEMRISDWSSDVCSSDLHLAAIIAGAPCGDQRSRFRRRLDYHRAVRDAGDDPVARRKMARERFGSGRLFSDEQLIARSEERRVGKECVQYVWISVVSVPLKKKNKKNEKRDEKNNK